MVITHAKDVISVPFFYSSDFATVPYVTHRFFSRNGGLSQGVYHSLNCAPNSGDDSIIVTENRSLAMRSLGYELEDLYSLHQIHSNKVITIDEEIDFTIRPQADAMVTALPNVVLGILTADCAPILLADDREGIIGAAHAGWKGALSGVVENTIEAMIALGARLQDIHVTIGPTIQQHSYEVDKAFATRFLDEDPDNSWFFKASKRKTHFQFDLPGYISHKLKKLGIRYISDVGQDTYSSAELFSYRRATHAQEEDYGRNLSVIVAE